MWGNPNKPFINITGGAMFFIFLIVCVSLAAWVWVYHPPSVIGQVLSGTREERTLRNLQDPLAMRLWVLGQSYWGEAQRRQEVTEKIIAQWAKEVEDLKAAAYHAKAADMQWDLSKVPMEEKERQGLKDAYKAQAEASAAGVPPKPGW